MAGNDHEDLSNNKRCLWHFVWLWNKHGIDVLCGGHGRNMLGSCSGTVSYPEFSSGCPLTKTPEDSGLEIGSGVHFHPVRSDLTRCDWLKECSRWMPIHSHIYVNSSVYIPELMGGDLITCVTCFIMSSVTPTVEQTKIQYFNTISNTYKLQSQSTHFVCSPQGTQHWRHPPSGPVLFLLLSSLL